MDEDLVILLFNSRLLGPHPQRTNSLCFNWILSKMFTLSPRGSIISRCLGVPLHGQYVKGMSVQVKVVADIESDALVDEDYLNDISHIRLVVQRNKLVHSLWRTCQLI